MWCVERQTYINSHLNELINNFHTECKLSGSHSSELAPGPRHGSSGLLRAGLDARGRACRCLCAVPSKFVAIPAAYVRRSIVGGQYE